MAKPTYSWLITKDHISRDGERNDVGTAGPFGMPLSAEQIQQHANAQPFRMYDDDGELYYEGLYVGEETEDLFGPLDDFGMPNAGCTSIHYQSSDGTWSPL